MFTFDDEEIEIENSEPFIKLNKTQKIDDTTLACNECDLISSSKQNLKNHKKTVHMKERFPCDQCGSVLKRKDHLKQHILSIHEGVRYTCDVFQCQFSALYPQNVNQHRKKVHISVHEK